MPNLIFIFINNKTRIRKTLFSCLLYTSNQTVGKRTKENGFGEAGAYLNGETVQEVGGLSLIHI